MKHLILLGDSIFDNRSYVNGGKDTIANLRDQMPDDWKATLLAIDGSVADSVSRQLPSVPNEATHLFISVGGNDALGEMGILQMRASAATEVFMELSNVVARFEGHYKRMLDSVLELNRPTAVCTIYYPQYPDERMQKVAVAALASFNDVIIRQAFLAGVPLIDLRYVCDEEEDYANPIEPSEAGGAKIARTILQVANEHDFSASKTSVYLGPALTNHREIESDCTSSVSPSFRAVSAAASQELNTKGQTPKDMPSALSTTLEADSIKVDFKVFHISPTTIPARSANVAISHIRERFQSHPPLRIRARKSSLIQRAVSKAKPLFYFQRGHHIRSTDRPPGQGSCTIS